MSIAFGPGDLLRYDNAHHVLICQECEYAIQKTAVQSHLLKHKIYRGERQKLLHSIFLLDLPEPDDVVLPVAGSLPVSGLPTIPGFKCTSAGCECLCASYKRMKRHWSEVHGISEAPASAARSASLQTFFRGNKIRYFEVATAEIAIETQDPGSESSMNVNILLDDTSTLANSGSLLSEGDLDMTMLRYFYHFTTVTVETLPPRLHIGSHWRTVVVTKAIESRWLMRGILALSAAHLSLLVDDQASSETHHKQSLLLSSKYLSEMLSADCGPSPTKHSIRIVGAQLTCIQRCYMWAWEHLKPHQAGDQNTIPFDLQTFGATVQGCSDPEFAWLILNRGAIPWNSYIRVNSGIENELPPQAKIHAPPALLDQLRTLPARMAERLGRPENIEHVYAALSAIDALVESLTLSYVSNETRTAWMGMESWLIKLSSRMRQMLEDKDTAALIVFAHWAILVKRAERYYWYLGGSAERLVAKVIGQLEDDNLKALVKDILEERPV